jgi:hypothetical protein
MVLIFSPNSFLVEDPEFSCGDVANISLLPVMSAARIFKVKTPASWVIMQTEYVVNF